MRHRTVTLTHGQPLYADLLDRIRLDMELTVAMWVDAESRPEELDVPDTRWSVALVADDVPAAWCAARVQADGTLKCHSNYEVRGRRGHGLYEAAYRERHRAVVLPSGAPAVTYLFEQPIAVHEADGWYLTGKKGQGDLVDHWWFELRRPAGEDAR